MTRTKVDCPFCGKRFPFTPYGTVAYEEHIAIEHPDEEEA